MKVYLVETLECDYETSNIVEGVFETKEKALAHAHGKYGFIKEQDIIRHHSFLGELVYYGYGWLGATHEAFDSGGYAYYYSEYKENGITEQWYVHNQTSITITEVEVK